MGLLDRLRHGKPGAEEPPAQLPPPGAGAAATSSQRTVSVTARLYGGDETLEVVGESYRQEALWRIVGAPPGSRVRHPVNAVLYPETANPHDPNAISVQIDGHLVGYLAREDAAAYRPGVLALMEKEGGSYIALEGVVIGGGHGTGSLGVFLDHDPEDFGLSKAGPPPVFRGDMRTGFSEAWLADADDDDYDLSWYYELPDGDRAGIAKLRELLASDPDPIDRHFQFAELEARLYRCRELYDGALGEYDDACRQHDSEMDVICELFVAKFGRVPHLDTYRQMAIRQQKLKNWQAVLWWAERGLSLYGDRAARDDAVEDLTKRRNRAQDKLDAATTKPSTKTRSKPAAFEAPLATDRVEASGLAPPGEIEILTCSECGGSFERLRVRGRKPKLCPGCRTLA